jgi:hypothetical protein
MDRRSTQSITSSQFHQSGSAVASGSVSESLNASKSIDASGAINTSTDPTAPVPSIAKSFTIKKPVTDTYTRIKGAPQTNARGYTSFRFDVYHGQGNPDPALAQLSDIYLDTTPGNEKIYAKVTETDWRLWVFPVPGAATWDRIDNPLVPSTRLWSSSGQGITWTTYHAAHTEKNRRKGGDGRLTIGDCVRNTLDPPSGKHGRKRDRSPTTASGPVAGSSSTPDGPPDKRARISPELQNSRGEDAASTSAPQGPAATNAVHPGIDGSTSTPQDPAETHTSPSPPQVSGDLDAVSSSAPQVRAGADTDSAWVPQVHADSDVPVPPQPDDDIDHLVDDVSPEFSEDQPATTRAKSVCSSLSSLSSLGVGAVRSGVRLLVHTLRAGIDLFVADRKGVEFPRSAKILTWPSGIQTAIPWMRPPDKNIGVSHRLTSIRIHPC